MSLTERISWVLTGLASAVSFIVSIFGEIPDNYKQPLILLGIIIPIIVAVAHKIKDVKNEQKIDLDYFVHTKRDIVAILEDSISEKQPSYVIALETLPEEQKEIIKAHFFTAEKSSKKYKGLYSNFNKILKVEKEFRSKTWEIHNFVSGIESDMYNIAEKNYTKNTKFNLLDFHKALQINHTFDFLRPEIVVNVSNLLLSPQYNLQQDDEKTTFIFNKIPIAVSDKYEICVKFHDCLIKQLPNLRELLKEADFSFNYKMQNEAEEYSQLIKNNFQAIKKGIPKIGACKSCLDYFPEKHQKKMDKYLDQFHNKHSKH